MEDRREEEPASSDEELFELGGREEEEEPLAQRRRLDADFLLDKVIPNEIDWRNMVRRHPLASIGVAAALGFLLGRAKGAAIIAGVSAGLTSTVMRQLSDVFEGEVFEF
jgi:hypothetical protein